MYKQRTDAPVTEGRGGRGMACGPPASVWSACACVFPLDPRGPGDLGIDTSLRKGARRSGKAGAPTAGSQVLAEWLWTAIVRLAHSNCLTLQGAGRAPGIEHRISHCSGGLTASPTPSTRQLDAPVNYSIPLLLDDLFQAVIPQIIPL